MGNIVVRTIAAFLILRGGVLLVGLNDEGHAIGLELDRFENNDKYLLHFSNLIEKIGKEFLDFIHWDLVDYEGKKVLKVDCLPSPTPVFVNQKGVEDFYIRSGPSTQKLSPSETLRYSKTHFHT